MRTITAAAFGAAALLSGPALAQVPCGDRAGIVAQLAESYDEAPVGRGLANNGGVLELLVAPDGRTWTILLTMPSGTACFVAIGRDWEVLPERPPGEGT